MPDFAQWIGRTESHVDWVVASRVAAWHATLDHDAPLPAKVTAVPPAIYWTLFPPLARTSTLAEDGHPRRGGFFPPIAQPRRMWAGSRLTFHRPMFVGDRLERESTIARIEEKQGRPGPLVFVTVRHVVGRDGEPVLEEEQDLVFREPTPAAAVRGAPPARRAI